MIQTSGAPCGRDTNPIHIASFTLLPSLLITVTRYTITNMNVNGANLGRFGLF